MVVVVKANGCGGGGRSRVRGGQGGGHFFPHVSAPLIFPPYLFGALSELLRFLLDKLFDLLGADLQPDHLGQRLLDDLVAFGRRRGRGGKGAMALSSAAIAEKCIVTTRESFGSSEGGSPASVAAP